MRRVIPFACEGATLLGTLDEAVAATGLLIVSGGNEIRVGAHRGQAALAAGISGAGYPVFRFDRRGVGDSEGENGGWVSSAPDIAAALAAFRAAQPQLTHIIALGNCDAATALARFGHDLGIDALVLTNPWTGGDEDALPPAAAIRRRYAEKLRDGATWKRALTGGVSFRKLMRGISKISQAAQQDVADQIAPGLERFAGPVTVVLATRDATAIGFVACWRGASFAHIRATAEVVEVSTASHSFQHAADRQALQDAVIGALVALSRSAPCKMDPGSRPG